MYFEPSPQNVTTLLVIALAIVSIVILLRGGYDSNMPILYYICAAVITTYIDRPIHPYLLISGVAAALILRFEFMSKTFTKVFGFLTTASICLTVVVLLNQVLGEGRPLF
jgi:hypothetical protein